jgi:hypothetical protein
MGKHDLCISQGLAFQMVNDHGTQENLCGIDGLATLPPWTAQLFQLSIHEIQDGSILIKDPTDSIVFIFIFPNGF